MVGCHCVLYLKDTWYVHVNYAVTSPYYAGIMLHVRTYYYAANYAANYAGIIGAGLSRSILGLCFTRDVIFLNFMCT